MTPALLVEHHNYSEKYRPKSTTECVLTSEVSSYVNKALAEKKVHNAVFVGPPGLGKTTTALALGEDLSLDVLKVNSSKDGTMDELRTTIQYFVQTASLTGEDKLLILDEADNLSPKMMGALRGFIEEYSAGCAFVLTVNNPNKLEDALLSRCPPVNFAIPADEQAMIMARHCKMVKNIFNAEGIVHKSADIVYTIRKLFPDLRKTINLIQRACEDGTFRPEKLFNNSPLGMDTLLEAMKSKTYVKLLEWVDHNPTVVGSKEVYRGMYELYRGLGDPDTLASAIITIEEYMDHATRSINPTVTLLGCLAKLLRDAPID